METCSLSTPSSSPFLLLRPSSLPLPFCRHLRRGGRSSLPPLIHSSSNNNSNNYSINKKEKEKKRGGYGLHWNGFYVQLPKTRTPLSPVSARGQLRFDQDFEGQKESSTNSWMQTREAELRERSFQVEEKSFDSIRNPFSTGMRDNDGEGNALGAREKMEGSYDLGELKDDRRRGFEFPNSSILNPLKEDDFPQSNIFTAKETDDTSPIQGNLILTDEKLGKAANPGGEEVQGFVDGKSKGDNKSNGEILTARKSLSGDNKRTMKRSKLMAMQVISRASALSLGFVTQVWIDTQPREIVYLEVKPSLLSGQVSGVLLVDVFQIGDVILLEDESSLVIEPINVDYDILIGFDLLTEDGYYLGKVRDYNFSLVDGRLSSVEFDSLGVSIIPSNIISTYWLAYDEVVEVSTDTLIVKKGAEKRARRLTKGFWQLPTVQGQNYNKKFDQELDSNQTYLPSMEEASMPNTRAQSWAKQWLEEDSRYGKFRRRPVSNKNPENNRWEPMDYEFLDD